MRWEQSGDAPGAEPFLVGRCHACSRRYDYHAITGELVSQTYEPLCRKCDHAIVLDATASTSARLVFACVEHRWQRWTYDPDDDVWTDFSLKTR